MGQHKTFQEQHLEKQTQKERETKSEANRSCNICHIHQADGNAHGNAS